VYEGCIGVDGAERSVLDGDVEVGEQVEGAAFADVGHPEQTHFKGCARTAQPHLFGRRCGKKIFNHVLIVNLYSIYHY
jgi:hypothetical protein